MTAFEILCRVTKPMTDAQIEEFIRVHYGALNRENISNDDPELVKEALRLVADAKLL